jgi:hypothetical protein
VRTRTGNFKIKLVAYDDRARANNTAYYYQQLLNVTDYLLGPCTPLISFAPSSSVAVPVPLALVCVADLMHCALSADGTSLTTVANEVADANDRLIVFANAQAEEVYNHGYPLAFGIGTRDQILSLSHLVTAAATVDMHSFDQRYECGRHVRLSLRRPGRVLPPNARGQDCGDALL